MESVRSPFRWTLEGSDGIAWSLTSDRKWPHFDLIEMTGFRSAVIDRYGADAQGNLQLGMNTVWPNLYTVIKKTNGYIIRSIKDGDFPRLAINGRPLDAERFNRAAIDGMLRKVHAFGAAWDLEVQREGKELVVFLGIGTMRHVKAHRPWRRSMLRYSLIRR